MDASDSEADCEEEEVEEEEVEEEEEEDEEAVAEEEAVVEAELLLNVCPLTNASNSAMATSFLPLTEPPEALIESQVPSVPS